MGREGREKGGREEREDANLLRLSLSQNLRDPVFVEEHIFIV